MADIVFPGQVAGGPLGEEYLPANYDLVLYKGDYLSLSVTLKDGEGVALDLTGYTAKCSLRTTFGAVESFDATCTITPAAGKVDIEFLSEMTSTLEPGAYVWDFQTTNPDDNNRTYFAGDVTVYGEVSQ